MKLIVTPLSNIPLISPKDDLAQITLAALVHDNIELLDGDVLVYAQKVVSKSEGRIRNLSDIFPSSEAIDLAKIVKKDPRLIELILDESKTVIRALPGILIVEHRSGFICANAGIDRSNVIGPEGETGEWVLLLPEDSDSSAKIIQEKIQTKTCKEIGVLIIDSHSRPWREGTVGVSIGVANVPAIIDLRGKKDLFNYTMQFSRVAGADELAATASLMMGQTAEKTPIVHIRGFPYQLRESSLAELIRPLDEDLFR